MTVCSQAKRKSIQTDSNEVPETVDNTTAQDDKRIKLNESSGDSKEDVKNSNKGAVVKKPSIPERCHMCQQLLDDPDLRLFPGDPCDAVSIADFSEYLVLSL